MAYPPQYKTPIFMQSHQNALKFLSRQLHFDVLIVLNLLKMRKLIIFLIFIFGLTKTAKADTIDFWHVYYNKTKIREFNLNGDTKFKTIVLGNIQKADFIVVKYFKDTPCSSCLTTLFVENDKHERVSSAQGKGTFNPVTLPLKDIIEHQKRTKHTVFDVYYFEGDSDNEKSRRFLFRIKLK